MTDDIEALRNSIDAIDDQLIKLLNERSGYVKKVGEIKKKTQKKGSAFIRPGREATMLRRMTEAFKDGTFPPVAAAQLWRIIISASLSLEAPLTVSAFASNENQEAYWLAREYFGSFTSVTKEPTSKRVLGSVMDGKTSVGLLPIPDDSPEGLWWPRLPEELKVFACVPFVLGKDAQIKTLAVAKIAPEPTGSDITLLSIETDMDVSQNRLKNFFDKNKLEVHWLATENFPSGHRAHLLGAEGFITMEDTVIVELKKDIGASLLAIRNLGAYATPIIL